MHGIIKEQQELQGTDIDVTFDKNENSTSSLVDEDLTQLPQEIEEIGVILKNIYFDKNVEVDLCHARIKNNKIENQNQEIDNLHRAISELTIQDDTILNVNYNLKQFSQSILVNLNTDDVNQQNKANENIVESNQNLEENTIISKEINDRRPHIKPAKIKNTQRRKLLNVSALVNNAANTATEFADNTYFDTNTDLPIAKNKRKVRKISRKINKDKNEQTIQNKRKKKSDETTKMPVKTEKKATKIKNKKDITKKMLNEMKNYHKNNAATTEVNKNLETNEMIHNRNNTVKDKLLWNSHNNASVSYATFTGKPTNNKDVENNLSWIDNIRYVREISKEEIIPTYYEDNFWKDYTLPNDWSDYEFL